MSLYPYPSNDYTEFDRYQQKTEEFVLPDLKREMKAKYMEYLVLGLNGEAGEVAEKYKKILRDYQGVITLSDKWAIVKELGDVLWYVAQIARTLGVDLSLVAKLNIEKLESRKERNMLHGDGDER